MKPFFITLLGFTFLVVCCTDGFAFRCGSGLVSQGDTKTQVLLTCGKPTMKESVSKGKSGKNKKGANKVEIWHYNCGENDFIYALTFENGKLISETTEGSGKGPSDCLGK